MTVPPDGTRTRWDGPVLVVGAGVTGRSVAVALRELGADVVVTATDAAQLAALAADGPTAGVATAVGLAEPPGDTALVVTSPGVRPDNPLLVAAAARGIEVIGDVELAWRLDRARATPATWLVVTGTNGKTTTVGMLEAMLRAGGLDAVACGNIGLPVLDAVRAGHTHLAVELSSFQLHWAPSVRPDAGAVLNVEPDHLDWHGTLDHYAASKARALDAGVAIAGTDDPGAARLLAASPARRRLAFTLGEPGPGRLGVRDGDLVDADAPDGTPGAVLAAVADVDPPGPSGVLDALAAAALARHAGVAPAAIRAALRAFEPAAHRGAVVAEVGGVRYVDNSKATNPPAAAAALRGLDGVVWIAGGMLKGADVDDLVREAAPRLRGVVLIGVDRGVIAAALARHAPDVPVHDVSSGDDDAMADAVRSATGLARPGDVVLLAPAAASWDMFTDYGQRGDRFAAAARALAAGDVPYAGTAVAAEDGRPDVAGAPGVQGGAGLGAAG